MPTPATEPDARLDPAAEAFLARLTLTAYDVALRQGIKGRFTELQSSLWRELRVVVGGWPAAGRPRGDGS